MWLQQHVHCGQLWLGQDSMFSDCLMGWMVLRLIPGGGEIFCTDQPRVSWSCCTVLLDLS